MEYFIAKAQVEKALRGQFHGVLNIYRSEPYFLELMPQNVDKATSIDRLAGSIGLTSEQIVCCGDGFNDISMIEHAGLGVAMRNAQEAVLEKADYVTASKGDRGMLSGEAPGAL